MDKKIIVSGARLTEGGLHLGHYLGNFSPRDIGESDNFEYYFIIENLSPPHYIHEPSKNNILIDIVADLLALDSPYNIRIVPLSEIIDKAPVLMESLKEIITVKQLRAIHPKRKILGKNDINISLSEMLFILNEVYYILAFDADYVFMNDDNLAFVNYARKVSHKFNNIHEKLLSNPYLVHGLYPRLLGADGTRMSKSRGNSIPLFSDTTDLKNHANKIVFGKKGAKLLRFDSEGYFKSHGFNIPVDFLPFVYLDIFSSIDNREIMRVFGEGRMSIHELESIVYDSLCGFIEPMREKQKYIRANASMVVEQLEHDLTICLRAVEKQESNIIRSLI